MRTGAILAIFGALSVTSPAATITDLWLGGAGNWGTAANWSAGSPDNAGGNVYSVAIASGGTDSVTLDTNVSIAALTLGGSTGSAALQTGPGSQSLQIGGPLALTQNGMLSLSLGDSLSVAGDLNNAGSLTLYTGSALTGGGNLNNSGVFVSSDNLSLAGALNNLAGGYLQVNANSAVNSLSNSGVLTIAEGSTLTLTGGGRGLTDVARGSGITVSGGFNVVNGGIVTSALANLSSVEGSFDLNNGQTNSIASLTNSGAFTLYGTSGLTAAGNLTSTGAFNNYGTLTVGGTYANQAGGSLLVNKTASLNSLTNAGQVTITSVGTLNLTGGGRGVTDIAAGSGYSVAGAFNVINAGVSTGALANLSTVEGTLELNNGQTLSLASLANSGTVSNYAGTALAVAGSIVNSGSLLSTGNLTVGGALNNKAGGYAQVNGLANVNTLANGGALHVATGATLNLTGGGRGVTDIAAGAEYTVSGTFNVINGGVATSALANLSSVEGTLTLNNGEDTLAALANTGSVTVNSGTTLTVSGDLNNSGSFLDYGATTVNGTLNNQAGADLEAGGSVAASDLTNGGVLNIHSYDDVSVGFGAEMQQGYTQSALGTLTEVLSGDSLYGVIDTTGEVSLGGTLDIELAGGYLPTLGETFDILNFTPGSLSGTFSTVIDPMFDNGAEKFLIGYDNAGGHVTLTAALLNGSTTMPPAPEPSTLLLSGAGLAALVLAARRARAGVKP